MAESNIEIFDDKTIQQLKILEGNIRMSYIKYRRSDLLDDESVTNYRMSIQALGNLVSFSCRYSGII